MKTIRRTATKKIAAIAKTIIATRAHEKHNDYVATPVPVEAALVNLETFDFAKLIDHENGKFTVQVHSGKWFYLYTAEWFQSLGRDAYTKPNPIAAPAADPAMTGVLNGMPVGTGAAELMLEWQKGWNAAAEEAAQAALADA